MASVNKVILIGNLTRDPELRHTPKGTAVTELGLAVNRKYRVQDETREEVTFIDVTFWGPAAETIQKYLTKGAPLYLEGRLKLDQWEDRETGKKRTKLSVIGEQFQFLGQGGGTKRQPSDDDPAAAPTAHPGTTQPPTPPTHTGPPTTGSGPLAQDDEEDEIPF